MTRGNAFADARVTVTVVQRTATGERNAYGNAVYSETRTEVPNCLVAWTGSQEDQTDADRMVDSATVYDLGQQWPVTVSGTDRVEIDGESWEVDGDPEHWPGQVGGAVVQLRKVRG